MDILLQDLTYAIRSLRRSPGFTAVVVAVLGLGIGVNTMIFCMVYGVMLRPWPFPDFDRVLTVVEGNPEKEMNRERVSWLNFRDLRERARSFSVVGGFWHTGGQVTIGDEPENMEAASISADLLPALGIQPQLGRNFARDEEVYEQSLESVIISDRVWKRRFAGTPDVLGKTLKLNGRVRTIVGVMPPGFQWPEVEDFWIPAAMKPEDARARADHNVTLVARPKPGVSRKQAQAEVEGIYRQIVAEDPERFKGWTGRVAGFTDEWRRDIRVMMTMVSLAVAFVLLIACANVANLMLARAASRRREISVRLALGASRGRVVRQLLTESLLLSLAGAAVGTALAIVGTRLWMSMIPLEIPFWLKFQIDLPVLAFTVVISVLSAVVFGLLPALQASDARLAEAIREGSAQAGTGHARHRARSTLVVAEVALSLTLLIGAGLMVRSFYARMDSERLVRSEGVLTARFMLPIATWDGDSARREFCDRVFPLAQGLPGVRSASIVTMLPLNRGSWLTSVVGELGARTDTLRPAHVNLAECYPGYFATLGIPLRAGRDFTLADGPGSEPVAVVNSALAQLLWPGKDPIGMRLRPTFDERRLGWRTVVGVVADVPQSLEGAGEENRQIMAALFVPHRQEPDQYLTWALRTDGEPHALAGNLRQLMRAQAPDVPLTEVRTMHEVVQFSVWMDRLFGTLMAVFAVIALVIAAVGLYGVMAYSVAQRTREIGIRMALGAVAGDVVHLVVGHSLRLTLLGIGIGFAAAFALTRGMTSVLFGISATDPPTYVGMVVILALSSLLAAWVPAHRATRVDPMRVLRCD